MNKLVTIALVTIVIIHSGHCYGQSKQQGKESYKSLKSRAFQNNIPDLIKEADAIKISNPAEALNKVQEALGLSIAEGDEFNEAKCYVLLGEINENIQEWKLAQSNYEYAREKLIDSHKATNEYRQVLRGLGNTNLKLNNYEDALIFFQEIYTLSTGEDEKTECQLNISEVYYQMGNYADALKALELTGEGNKKVRSSLDARVQNQRAKIFARTNEMTKTQALYQNSINTLKLDKDTDQKGQQSVQETKEEIAGVFHEQKRYDDEISVRNQSIEYNLGKNNFEEVANDKVAISKSLDAMGETAAAIKEVEEAIRIADTLNNPKEQAKAYLALAGLYEKKGKEDLAVKAYQKYSQAIIKSEKQSERQLHERSELIEKQKDIEKLTKDVSIGQREETIEKATVFRQQLIIYGLVLIILIIGATSYFIYKSAQASKVANQMLALKSLRSQMNPHFIFNALNSVNHFIAQQDERTANKFLSEFSQLMRLVLENSQEDFISLQKEQEILSLYLKLEHYRFRDKFDYQIDIDKDINIDTIYVPPMLIQPYIENAVWHGLRYKDTKGKLTLTVRKENEDLVVEISDDGIGRKRSSELKTENQKKHNSTGLKNIQQRLSIINKIYKSNYRVLSEDLEAGTGTRVRIYLPIVDRNE